MSEIISAERAKYNWEKALEMAASVKNDEDKKYWNGQAEQWLELYTKVSTRDKATTKAALTSFNSSQILYSHNTNGTLRK